MFWMALYPALGLAQGKSIDTNGLALASQAASAASKRCILQGHPVPELLIVSYPAGRIRIELVLLLRIGLNAQ